MFCSTLKKLKEGYETSQRRRALSKFAPIDFPHGVLTLCQYLATNSYPDPASERVALMAEQQRQRIVSVRGEPIEILYSPKPGSTQDPEQPVPGAKLFFSPERIARTGKDKRWGGFLHLCARESGAKSLIELGTCAGISAYYLASASNVERLITIEGSSVLANIAKETLQDLSSKTEVINALFDDALEDILPALPRIDLAYLDGHHEKIATIQYFDRIKHRLSPNAWVLFDDVSWSLDMRECWEELTSKQGFSYCLDFGAIGLCIWNGGEERGKILDLRGISGVKEIGKPHGWRIEDGGFVR